MFVLIFGRGGKNVLLLLLLLLLLVLQTIPQKNFIIILSLTRNKILHTVNINTLNPVQLNFTEPSTARSKIPNVITYALRGKTLLGATNCTWTVNSENVLQVLRVVV